MSKMRFGRAIVAFAVSAMFPLAALADEIVHFTNGAEMTVRAHVVEKEKQMVRLDLGQNNFIAFPMAMVDKIVNAGRDVYLNPTFHPANQAIAGGAGVPADTSIKGISEPVNQARKGGTNRGEAAGIPVPASNAGPYEQPMANSRRTFDPANPPSPGERPQVVMVKGMAPKVAPMMPLQLKAPDSPPPQPTIPQEPQPQAQENPPAAEQPDSESPPDAP